jgi:hypothetical protein
LPAIVFAEDFKTVNGKEYKNATVSRVEPDGIVLKTKSGVTKIYFSELPKEVQERFHYDPQQAAAVQAAAAQHTGEFNRQAAELDKQQKGAYNEQLRQSAEQQGKLRNAQAVADRLADLERQELNLLAEIGRVKNAQGLAWRRWTSQDYRNKQAFTDPGEANLPLLKGRLQNVQDEKDPVRKEQERAQRQQ